MKKKVEKIEIWCSDPPEEQSCIMELMNILGCNGCLVCLAFVAIFVSSCCGMVASCFVKSPKAQEKVERKAQKETARMVTEHRMPPEIIGSDPTAAVRKERLRRMLERRRQVRKSF